MFEPSVEHEHGGEYQPDAFGALDSLEDLKAERPAMGCLAAYMIVAVIFLAELLRYSTGSGKWWLVLIAVPFFFPRMWAAFRMWQSPQMLDRTEMSRISWRDRRLWIMVAIVLMIAEFEFKLFWPTIREFFTRAW